MVRTLPPPERPLYMCLEHFLGLAKQHYLDAENRRCSLDFVLRTLGVTKLEGGANKTLTPPTRIQPRRAAKENVQAKIEEQKKRKRQCTTKAPASREKRQRIFGDFEPTSAQQQTHWPEIEAKLKQLIQEGGQLHLRNGRCAYGSEPWSCMPCRVLEAGLAGWNDSRGTAPVAKMDLVGELFDISPWNYLELLKPNKLGFGDLSFVVDSCKNTMILVL